MRTTARSPTRESRGLVGHSMGGYGAARIGMKHPDVFGALYIMSPCCLSPMTGGGPGPADEMKQRAIDSEKKAASAKSPAELAANRPALRPRPMPPPPRGRLTRRTRLSTSTCPPRTGFRNRRSSRSSRPMRRLPSWTSTSAI